MESENKNELELLKDELQTVLKVSNQFNINHTHVAKECGIGYEYSRAIRNDGAPKTNTPENCDLLQKMIDAYRSGVRKKQEALKSLQV